MAWPIMGDDGCGKGCDRGVQRCRRVVNHSTGDLERSKSLGHKVAGWEMVLSHDLRCKLKA